MTEFWRTEKFKEFHKKYNHELSCKIISGQEGPNVGIYGGHTKCDVCDKSTNVKSLKVVGYKPRDELIEKILCNECFDNFKNKEKKRYYENYYVPMTMYIDLLERYEMMEIESKEN